MLRIVLPVSHVDEALARELLNHLKNPDDCSHRYPATLVLSKFLGSKAEELKALAEEAFSDVQVVVCPNEDERGWPMSANHLFRTAVTSIPEDFPFLWLEADSTPLSRDWLDQLVLGINESRKLYLGTTRAARLKKAGTDEVVGEDGRYMIGVGVYPRDFSRRSLLVHYIDAEPFDVYLRWEIAPLLCDSPLVAHNWKSSNFRHTTKLEWDGDDQTPFSTSAVLHHGCKDGSLLRLLSPVSPAEEVESKKIELPKPEIKRRGPLPITRVNPKDSDEPTRA